MIKTIKYFLKKRKLFLLVLTGIVFVVTAISLSDGNYITQYYNTTNGKFDLYGPVDTPFVIPTIVAAFLATLIPIYEMRFKMNKIVIDQVYSLPIKREKYYLAKYLVGLIEIMIPVLVSSLFSFISVSLAKHLYELWYFFPYLLVLIIYTTAVYSIYCFFFTRGNTTIDGIVNMIFATFFVTLISANIFEITKTSINGVGSGNYILFVPFVSIYNIFDDLMRVKSLTSVGLPIDVRYESAILPIVLNIILGIGSFVLFVFLSKKEKAEDATQISNSWFSYKFFLPTYFFMIVLYG